MEVNNHVDLKYVKFIFY